jgi:hypothetical protein
MLLRAWAVASEELRVAGEVDVPGLAVEVVLLLQAASRNIPIARARNTSSNVFRRDADSLIEA